MATATLSVTATVPSGWKYVTVGTPDLSNTLAIAYSLSPTLATSDLIVFSKWFTSDGVTTSYSITVSTNSVPSFANLSGSLSVSFLYFIWDETTSNYGSTATYSITDISFGGGVTYLPVNNIWQWIQQTETTPGGVTDKIQVYLTGLGYTGATNEALYAWLGALGYVGTLAERISAFERVNTARYG